jgi:predicted NBD/HSP70 family sugar kinase
VRRINLKRASVARADTIRSINRRIVLNYVRERAPISRAEIAHETALQRSTVSLIVSELTGEGLVEEVEGESTGGRPPVLLRLRAAEPVAVGVDLGTTTTVVATGDLAGRIRDHEEFATHPDAGETLKRIIACTRRLIGTGAGSIEGIGMSLPGLVDTERGRALFIPYFKWRDLEVKREVSAATGLPVTVDNDANAAALAELWFGQHGVNDVRDFIMVLVAEGLGTGIVIDGQVYRGEGGAAGEFGHMTLGSGAPVSCATGSRDCWEAFASELAALARYESLARRRGGRRADDFTQLVSHALEGEYAAKAALLETARYLGIGIANLIKGLSPEAVVVGGKIVRAWPIIAEEVKSAVAENIMCRDLPTPRLITSSLGEQPDLIGALSLVLAGKFASVLMG